MADFDHTLNMLKMHIKKEIIDNYFAERTYLEEDLELLAQKEKEYEIELNRALPVFAAFLPTSANGCCHCRGHAALGGGRAPFLSGLPAGVAGGEAGGAWINLSHMAGLPRDG